MPGSPYNPYQNSTNPKITAVNKGDPGQIGATIGRNILGNTGTNQPIFGGVGNLFQGLTIKTFFFYGISAAALIALAEYQPQVAILFTMILIVGVLLTHWADFAPLLKGP